MRAIRIAITLETDLLHRLDLLVAEGRFPTRSRAIQEAVRSGLEGLERGRLARECAKLDPEFEQRLAEQGLTDDLAAWPQWLRDDVVRAEEGHPRNLRGRQRLSLDDEPTLSSSREGSAKMQLAGEKHRGARACGR